MRDRQEHLVHRLLLPQCLGVEIPAVELVHPPIAGRRAASREIISIGRLGMIRRHEHADAVVGIDLDAPADDFLHAADLRAGVGDEEDGIILYKQIWR